MKREELVNKSIRIITEYYRGNLDPFFENIAENVLWIGPRGGQILRGRDMIIKTWTAETTDLVFSMGNIAAESVPAGRNNLEILLEYFVYTHFPSGEIDQHHQRLHLSWGLRTVTESGKRKVVPEICMIHISNISAEQEDPGKVYATSSENSRLDAINTSISRVFFRTITGKGEEEITWFFNSATILWIESRDEGRHSIIHTIEGNYASMERLRYFEENYSDVLLRSHASYLINPLYVRSIKRFELTLTDGTSLPIPEKKYTAFRNKLTGWKWSHS